MGFFDIITKIDETLTERKDKENFQTGLKRYALFYLAVGALGGIIFQLMAFIPIIGQLISGILFVPLITVPIIVIVGGLALTLIASFILFLAAKIMGGTGEFGQQFGVSSLVLWPVIVLSVIFFVVFIVLFLLVLIPFVGVIFLLLAYGLMYFYIGFISTLLSYFSVIYLREVHKLTTFKTALTVGISTAILIMLFFILVFLISLLFLGSMTALTSTGFGGLPAS